MPLLIPSLLQMKCPVCRTGDVFVYRNAYNMKTFGEIHSLCPVCGKNFRPEPGFYFGSAVVSYPMMVMFNLVVMGVYYLVVGDLFHHVGSLMLTMLIATLIVAPVMFRYARIIWLYIAFK